MLVTAAAIIPQCAAVAHHPVAGIYDRDRIAGTGGTGGPGGQGLSGHGGKLSIGNGVPIGNEGHCVEPALTGRGLAFSAQGQVESCQFARQIGLKLANCFT